MEDAIDVLRKELAWESDYVREAECATKFRYIYSLYNRQVVLMTTYLTRYERCKGVMTLYLQMSMTPSQEVTMFFVFVRSLLGEGSGFIVPEVIPDLSTQRVMTSELVHGVPLDSCTELSQDVRNDVRTVYSMLFFFFHL